MDTWQTDENICITTACVLFLSLNNIVTEVERHDLWFNIIIQGAKI